MTEEVKTDERIKVTKGFTVGIDEEGKIHIEPFGISGDLELLGLMNFVDIKRKELLEYIAGTASVKTLALSKATGEGVAALLNVLTKQVPKEADEIQVKEIN